MTLQAKDLARLEAASRVLVSPLAAPSSDAWLREAGAAVRELVCGTSVVVQIGTGPVPYFSDDAPDVVDGVQRVVDAVLSEGVRFSDPVTDLWNRLRREQHIETFSWDINRRMVEAQGVTIDEGILIDQLRLSGYRDFVGLVTPTPLGESMIWVLHQTHGSFPFGEHTVRLLNTLMPSFRSGLDALSRLGAHRAALDALTEPLAAFGPSGRELHRNTALSSLLASDPESAQLEGMITQLGRSHSHPSWSDGPPAAEAALRTAHARYTLRTTMLPPGLFGADPAVLVTVAVDRAPSLPAAETIRERLGLTIREAEVALLLAEGLSNAELADRLFIATATARRHTENILGKLGLTKRAAVAATLLGVT